MQEPPPGPRSQHGAGRECFAVTGRRDEIERIEQRLLEAMSRCGHDQAAAFSVRIAFEEVVSNAIHHGNGGDPTREVRVRFAAAPTHVEIEVEDGGLGFDPQSVPDPTQAENVDIPSGRGIMLMRAYMTEVEFIPPGNRVRLRYVRQGACR